MSTRTTQTNDDAVTNFNARKAEVDDLLARLKDASANHFNTRPDDIRWGHVGNLTSAAAKLREIAAFLDI